MSPSDPEEPADPLPRPEEPEPPRWPQLPEDEEAMHQQSGLPRRSRGQRHAITWLRAALYLTPAPAFLFASASIDRYPHPVPEAVWIAVVVATVVLIVGMGIFDGFVSATVAKRNHMPGTRSLTLHVISFFLFQMLFGPVFGSLILIVGGLLSWLFGAV